MLNRGDGTFLRAEIQTGTASYALSWGSIFFDYDNDGIQDLYVCNMTEGNRLYRHGGNWPCTDVAAQMGVADPGLSFVIAYADIDLDGDLDLALSNRNDPIRLFINHEGTQKNWVRLNVIGTGQQRWSPNSTVTITTEEGVQYREVFAVRSV